MSQDWKSVLLFPVPKALLWGLISLVFKLFLLKLQEKKIINSSQPKKATLLQIVDTIL